MFHRIVLQRVGLRYGPRYISTLPPLLKLPEKLHTEVFTHASVSGANTALSIDQLPNAHHRLAVLGDAALEACVTDYLFQKHPRDTKGELSIRRSRIVSNEQLAKWADQYGLIRNLQTASGATSLQVDPSERVRATLMEAYFGAVHLQYGSEALCKWVADILDVLPPSSIPETTAPSVKYPHDTTPESYSENPSYEPGSPVPHNEISLLFEKAAAKKVVLRWDDQAPPSTWITLLSVEGHTFHGHGQSKQAARLDASKKALRGLNWHASDS
ncbi:ribonuclease III [Sistotremastrum suecicum HHB10207 ss-3]|uniref:Ribonuclease III n=1 Tax=Sistotremastrum suecicum HHB10207 ss-3 TaxID=1314776 RepID=A0A166ASX1_9AGAM|nr:ribonuclease III [Sistotremastrum suecicum HHB10207 ss-3]